MEVSERFLQTALDGIQDCINIVDKDFKIIFMNETASQRAGKNGNYCWETSAMQSYGKKVLPARVV